MKVVLLLAGVAIAVVWALSAGGPPEETDPVKRIDAGCRREFEPDYYRVNDCKIRLLAKHALEQDADRMRRAAR